MFETFRKTKDALSTGVLKRAARTQITEAYHALAARERARLPDDIALKGYKAYSQSDEDGVLAAIFAAIGNGSTFLEIGVEDGRECNSHLLLLKGWRGAWIEGDAASVSSIEAALGGSVFPGRFQVRRAFVEPGNIAVLYRETCGFLAVDELDLLSLDIDSNDAYVAEALLASGARPAVCCVEYNAAFPPDLAICAAYRDAAAWQGDDYFGASLLHFANVFGAYGYRLVTCNLTGANAFFVREDHAHRFPTRAAADVWRPLRLDLTPLPGGHEPSLRWLRDRLSGAA